MKKHSLDLFALLAGLAFAIAGGAVIISQATDSDVSGRWAVASGLIVLGVVALVVTLAGTLRSPARVDPAPGDAAGTDPWVSPEDRAG